MKQGLRSKTEGEERIEVFRIEVFRIEIYGN
jgi:hypothetical protein